ncbi:hypothetical protein [Nocardiopsis chromatogenes]|uniref:hypothetical protein n=1 Tax=Nocardiopsis chromatogenes TaxID=280239 RepID=UPI00034874DD|nr:hypothetical protein [Nocardiopsis chromatogenes]
MDSRDRDLDDLVRQELGEEPSQEAKDYARELYEKYRAKVFGAETGEQDEKTDGAEGSE